MSTNSAKSSLNYLRVSVHRIVAAEGGCGDPENMPTTFKIHISSPIEERTITQLYNPIDPTADGSLAKFESIEISNALLSVELLSNEDGTSSPKLLGVSAPHDLLPLCQDMELWKNGGQKKTNTVEIVLVAEKGTHGCDLSTATEKSLQKEDEETKTVDEEAWKDAVSGEMEEEPEKKEYIDKEGALDNDGKEKNVQEDGDAEETNQPTNIQEGKKTAEIQLPLYTLTVHLEYTPSPDDKRDALYDKLNEVSKRKVAAIESLRKSAAIVNRDKASDSNKNSSGVGEKKGPAVKSGFLNKPSSKTSFLEGKPSPFWKRWYDKTLGSQSILWVVGPVAKNYILFAGLSFLIHYKGDLLALPPPV